MTTTPTKNESLPELPASFGDHCVTDSVRTMRESGYTANQMREYGRACYEAALTREAPTEGVVSNDTLCMDWLERHLVEVREPLRYGSAHMFYALQVNDEGEPYLSDLRKRVLGYAMTATPPAPQRLAQGDGSIHPDDLAVDLFASAMKAKLEFSRKQRGRGGWQDKSECTAESLSEMLRRHVEKGDPTDVANFCCFLWNRQEGITQPPHHDRGEVVRQTIAALTNDAGCASAFVFNPQVVPLDVAVEAIEKIAALTEAKQQGPGEAVDAARWRALVGCARIRVLGSAGLTKDQPNNYAHLGLELWTHHEAGNEGPAVEWLTKFADKARLVQAPQVEAKRQTGEVTVPLKLIEDAREWVNEYCDSFDCPDDDPTMEVCRVRRELDSVIAAAAKPSGEVES